MSAMAAGSMTAQAGAVFSLFMLLAKQPGPGSVVSPRVTTTHPLGGIRSNWPVTPHSGF